jgi:hypothetical protein
MGVENAREPGGRHERVPDGRDVGDVGLILQQHGLAEQVAEGDPQRARQRRESLDVAELPLPALDLAEPVRTAPGQVGELGLSQATAGAVESDPLPHRQPVIRPAHPARMPADGHTPRTDHGSAT